VQASTPRGEAAASIYMIPIHIFSSELWMEEGFLRILSVWLARVAENVHMCAIKDNMLHGVAVCSIVPSMKPDQLLKEAQLVDMKGVLEPHREAIFLLREKGYTWREISDFLNDRGIETDHTKVYRFFKKIKLDEVISMKRGIHIADGDCINLERIYSYRIEDDVITLSTGQLGDVSVPMTDIRNKKTYSLGPDSGPDYILEVNEFKRVGREIEEFMGMAKA